MWNAIGVLFFVGLIGRVVGEVLSAPGRRK